MENRFHPSEENRLKTHSSKKRKISIKFNSIVTFVDEELFDLGFVCLQQQQKEKQKHVWHKIVKHYLLIALGF